MAVYTDDFSSLTVDQTPVGWTRRLNDNWDSTAGYVTTHSNNVNGMAFRLDPSSSSRKYLSLDAIDSDPDRADCEILYKYITPTGNNTYGFKLCVRANDTIGSETTYVLYQVEFDQFAIHKYVNGSSITLTSTFVQERASDWEGVSKTPYWVRFKINGNQIKAKVWPCVEDEPTIWSLEFTDNDITGVGHIGFGVFTHSMIADLLYYSIATGTDVPVFDDTPKDLTKELRTTAYNIEYAKTNTPLENEVQFRNLSIEAALQPQNPTVQFRNLSIEAALQPQNPTVQFRNLSVEVAFATITKEPNHSLIMVNT